MKIDLHCHTLYSYDGASSPERIIKRAIEMGLDGIAITDHENAKGWQEALEMGKKMNFLVVLGEEMKTNKGDVLGLFMKEQIDGYKKDPRWVMEEIKKQGGLVIIPHPFHGIERFKDDMEKYLDLIDGIEVFNGRKPMSSPDKKAYEFAKKHNLAMTGGSDSHYYKGVGCAYTECEAKTIEELKKCILQKKTAAEGKKSPFIYIVTPLLAKIGLLGRN